MHLCSIFSSMWHLACSVSTDKTVTDMESLDQKNVGHKTCPQDIHNVVKELKEEMKKLQKEKQGTVLYQVVREVTTP